MAREINVNDIVGNKYGMLTVKKYADKVGAKHYYDCDCDCGGSRRIARSNIMTGNTKSCGCINKQTGRHKRKSKKW